MRLINARRGRVLASSLRPAHTFASRLKGLALRKHLPAGEGLWLSPCRAIHTFGMRFSIDALFLDADLRVVAARENVAPWRLLNPVRRTESVIELPAGTVRATGTAVGDELTVETEGNGAAMTKKRSTGRGSAVAAIAILSLAAIVAPGCAAMKRARADRAEAASARLAEGIRLESEGMTGEAIDRFSEAAALDPENVETRCRLAAALASVPERAGEAIAHLDAAAAACPQDPAVWIDIGNVYARLGALESAHAAYAEAQALDRANPSALFNRGLMEIRLNRGDAAEATFGSYLRLRPRDAEGFYLLGRARMIRADRAGARSALEECLKIDPAHLEARESLGLVALAERDFVAAERAFLEVLRRDPENERVARRISGMR